MPGPTITYWQVTSPGSGIISHLNGIGGPVATQLGATPLDFEVTEAGQWSKPAVLLVKFSNVSAKKLKFKLYDTAGPGLPAGGRDNPIDSNLEANLLGGWSNGDPNSSDNSWVFRIDLKAQWVDPASISTDPANSPIDSWDLLPWTSYYVLDDEKPPTCNDYTSNLLVTADGFSSEYYTNFFVYISAKPKTTAISGEHIDWGFRLSYIYPGS